MSAITLICPRDKKELVASESGLCCSGCGYSYPVEEGVVRLLDRPDEFYEGAYETQMRFLPRSERPWHIWPLWLINSGYPWMVRRHVRPGATVVELGCAGGVRYLGRRYRMVGCDLSFSSLKKLDMYEYRVQADAGLCIPLPDASVDAVVSSYFWEHIPPQLKPAILQECQRILRPGGKIIFLYDVETENPLIRPFKDENPSRYKELFIDGDGHLGYESPRVNINALRSAGFDLLDHRGLEKTWIQSPSAYAKLAQFGGRTQGLFSRLKALGKSPWFYPYTMLMRLIDTFVCPWLPDSWARINLLVAVKPNHEKLTPSTATTPK